MYEEIHAFRKAAEKAGLTGQDIEKIFYSNAARLLGDVGFIAGKRFKKL